jgi:hypothetical protein
MDIPEPSRPDPRERIDGALPVSDRATGGCLRDAAKAVSQIRENRLGTWDLLDYAAVVGAIACLTGFVMGFLPSLREGGLLVPLGLCLMAGAAFAARAKDGDAT